MAKTKTELADESVTLADVRDLIAQAVVLLRREDLGLPGHHRSKALRSIEEAAESLGEHHREPRYDDPNYAGGS